MLTYGASKSRTDTFVFGIGDTVWVVGVDAQGALITPETQSFSERSELTDLFQRYDIAEEDINYYNFSTEMEKWSATFRESPEQGMARFIHMARTRDLSLLGSPTGSWNDPYAVPGPFIRRNGEVYIPRTLNNHQDVGLLRHLVSHGFYPRLSGLPGVGKTALVEAAFPDCITVIGHGDMTVANLVGSMTPVGQAWRWADGPLTTAMREGKVLFIDEILRIPPEVLSVLYGATDGRNMLRIDDNPEMPVVHASEGFGVICAYNPDIRGLRRLDDALLSRFFIGFDIETDEATIASMDIHPRILDFVKAIEGFNEQTKKTKVWVPQIREMINANKLVETGMTLDFALKAIISVCPERRMHPTLEAIANKIVTA